MISERILESDLGGLKPKQIKVLYWLNKGYRPPEIAEIETVHLSENRVWAVQGELFKILNVPDRKTLLNKYGELLDELTEDDLEKWRPSRKPSPSQKPPQTISRGEEVLQEDKPIPAPDIFKPKQPVITKRTSQPRRTNNPFLIIIVLLAFLAISIFVIGVLLYTLLAMSRHASHVVSASEIITLTNKPATLPDTSTHSLTPSSIPTRTLEPTPTATLEPTPTPPPTPTEIFVPPADGILFFDNFDSGLSSEWETYGDPPGITQGALITAKYETWLIVGDSRWENYRVEFDILGYRLGVVDVGVHALDMSNMMQLNLLPFNYYWEICIKNSCNMVQDTYDYFGYGDKSVYGHATIAVQNNVINASLASYTLPAVTDLYFNQGKVVLRITNDIMIDNFLITWLP